MAELKIKKHPFTVITKDDGSKVAILGFDKQKLDAEISA